MEEAEVDAGLELFCALRLEPRRRERIARVKPAKPVESRRENGLAERVGVVLRGVDGIRQIGRRLGADLSICQAQLAVADPSPKSPCEFVNCHAPLRLGNQLRRFPVPNVDEPSYRTPAFRKSELQRSVVSCPK